MGSVSAVETYKRLIGFAGVSSLSHDIKKDDNERIAKEAVIMIQNLNLIKVLETAPLFFCP